MEVVGYLTCLRVEVVGYLTCLRVEVVGYLTCLRVEVLWVSHLSEGGGSLLQEKIDSEAGLEAGIRVHWDGQVGIAVIEGGPVAQVNDASGHDADGALPACVAACPAGHQPVYVDFSLASRHRHTCTQHHRVDG